MNDTPTTETSFLDPKHEREDWKKHGPWVAVDSESNREWVFLDPPRYYVVQERTTGEWFICDRWSDLEVHETRAKTRPEAIRKFYKWCERPLPEGAAVGKPTRGAAHQGNNYSPI